MASSSSNWTLFLKVVEDFLNECESHMSGQEYGVFESLIERLHASRNGCLRIAYWLSSLSENQVDFERISKTLCETLQGVIDCVEEKLCDIDPSSYVSFWIPEALVHRSGLVGRPRLALNLV